MVHLQAALEVGMDMDSSSTQPGKVHGAATSSEEHPHPTSDSPSPPTTVAWLYRTVGRAAFAQLLGQALGPPTIAYDSGIQALPFPLEEGLAVLLDHAAGEGDVEDAEVAELLLHWWQGLLLLGQPSSSSAPSATSSQVQPNPACSPREARGEVRRVAMALALFATRSPTLRARVLRDVGALLHELVALSTSADFPALVDSLLPRVGGGEGEGDLQGDEGSDAEEEELLDTDAHPGLGMCRAAWCILSWMPHLPSDLVEAGGWMEQLVQLLATWSGHRHGPRLFPPALAGLQAHAALLHSEQLATVAHMLLERLALLPALRWFVGFQGRLGPEPSHALLLRALPSTDWPTVRVALHYLGSLCSTGALDPLVFSVVRSSPKEAGSGAVVAIQTPEPQAAWAVFMEAYTISKEAASLVFYEPVEGKLAYLLRSGMSIAWITLLFRNLFASKCLPIRRQFALWLTTPGNPALPQDLVPETFAWLLLQVCKHFPPHPPSRLVGFVTRNLEARPVLLDGVLAALRELHSPIGLLALSKGLSLYRPPAPVLQASALALFATLLPRCTMYEQAAHLKAALAHFLDACLRALLDSRDVGLWELLEYFLASQPDRAEYPTAPARVLPRDLVPPGVRMGEAFPPMYHHVLQDGLPVHMRLGRARRLLFLQHSMLLWPMVGGRAEWVRECEQDAQAIREVWEGAWLGTLCTLASSRYTPQASKDGALVLLRCVLERVEQEAQARRAGCPSAIVLGPYFAPLLAQLDLESVLHYFLLHAEELERPSTGASASAPEDVARMLELLELVPLLLAHASRLPALAHVRGALVHVMEAWAREREPSIPHSVLSLRMLAIAHGFLGGELVVATAGRVDATLTQRQEEGMRTVLLLRYAPTIHRVPLSEFRALQVQLACSMWRPGMDIDGYVEQLDCALAASIPPLLRVIARALAHRAGKSAAEEEERDRLVQQAITLTCDCAQEHWEEGRDLKEILDALVAFVRGVRVSEAFDHRPFLERMLAWSMDKAWVLRKLAYLFTIPPTAVPEGPRCLSILERNVDWLVQVVGWIPNEARTLDFSEFAEHESETTVADEVTEGEAPGRHLAHPLPETIRMRALVVQWVTRRCPSSLRTLLAEQLIEALGPQMRGCRYPNHPPFYRLMYQLTILHLVLPDVADPSRSIQGLHRCIPEQTQIPLLHLLEWAIARLVLRAPAALESLVAQLTWSTRAHVVVSVLTICLQLCTRFPLPELLDRLLAEHLVVWLNSHHFTIRVLGQALFTRRHHLRQQQGGAVGHVPLLPARIMDFLHCAELAKHLPKVEADPFLASGFDPLHVEVEFLVNGVFDLSKSPDAKVSVERSGGEVVELVEELEGLRLPTGRTAKTAEMDRTQGDGGEAPPSDLDVFQRKVSSLTFHDSRGSAEAPKRHSIVVNAALLAKVPNLAGLCRSAEIFRAERLILPSLAVLKDPNFMCTSVTSERWMPLEAVGPEELLPCLERYRAEGYCIVGIEQSSTSVPLDTYSFPPKVMLVIGNEKTGIPAPIMLACDVLVEIRQWGRTKSLNAHVSGSLCLWEFVKHHALAL